MQNLSSHVLQCPNYVQYVLQTHTDLFSNQKCSSIVSKFQRCFVFAEPQTNSQSDYSTIPELKQVQQFWDCEESNEHHICDGSFLCRTIKNWNSLPDHVFSPSLHMGSFRSSKLGVVITGKLFLIEYVKFFIHNFIGGFKVNVYIYNNICIYYI